MQKTLKPTYFMKEMHEYDFKSFSKIIEFNLDLSKQDYDTFCPQNSIRLNHICPNTWNKLVWVFST